ncbi:hypothetical protein LTR85_000277 [Meristemomyces frigidus]|nr:hypothetical protein LTR85_000277 [Meristemomyces frigidus]
MGLIKTAIISGAAVYGVNQIAKTAANRNSNGYSSSSPPRSESRRPYYADEEQYYRATSPRQLRDREQRPAGQYAEEYYSNAGPYNPPPPPPRRYLEAEGSYGSDPSTYAPRTVQDDQQQQQHEHYRYDTRGSPMPPPYNSGPQRQRGYVEPEQDMCDAPQGSGSSRRDLVGAFAQQDMGSLGGGQKGKDGNDGKGGLLSSVFK